MNYRIYIISTSILIVLLGVTLHLVIQKAIKVREVKNRAIRAHREKDCDQAILLADQYLAITNENAFPHQVLSDCYYRKRKMDKALKHADLAIAHLPTDQYLYYLRGRVLLETGDTTRGCLDITNTIKAKGAILKSNKYTLDYMDTSRFMDVNYRQLLDLRIKYCGKIMPDQIKIDQQVLESGQ